MKLKKFIKDWLFKEELKELSSLSKKVKSLESELNTILDGLDVSVDVHEYDTRRSPSWAVISLQGKNTSFIKFVDLGDRNIQEISSFLRAYERRANIKIDANPQATRFIKAEINQSKFF